jgi:hypothetical protein
MKLVVMTKDFEEKIVEFEGSESSLFIEFETFLQSKGLIDDKSKLIQSIFLPDSNPKSTFRIRTHKDNDELFPGMKF